MIVARMTGGDAPIERRVRDARRRSRAAARGGGRRATRRAAWRTPRRARRSRRRRRRGATCSWRSGRRAMSAGSADFWPSRMPCASDACGSGSARPSASESVRRTRRMVARDDAVVLVADDARARELHDAADVLAREVLGVVEAVESRRRFELALEFEHVAGS